MRQALGLVRVLALTGSLVVLAAPVARADDTDIFGANVQPNVMLMLDNAGSMADTILPHPYAPATTYNVVNVCGSRKTQACTSTVVFALPKTSQFTLYKNTIADVPAPAARTALSTAGFWSGKIGGSTVNLFVGNYLNYQIGFCPGAPCQERKIDIATRTLKNVITN